MKGLQVSSLWENKIRFVGGGKIQAKQNIKNTRCNKNGGQGDTTAIVSEHDRVEGRRKSVKNMYVKRTQQERVIIL